MTVYKYYSPADYNFDAIEKGYFFFSKAEKLNDPFDVSLKLINESTKFKALVERLFPNEHETFSNKYGICSFSTDGLNKPMWSKYADNYRGFVVEYDEEQFEMITKNLCMPIPYFDVHYVDKCPNLDTKDMKIHYRNIGEKEDSFFLLNDNSIRDPKNLDRVFQYLWSIKEKEGWSHEKERRMFLGNVATSILSSKITYEDAGYKVPFPKKCLKRIIIGYNMEGNNVERMNNICNAYGLQGLHSIHVSDKPFDLDIISFQRSTKHATPAT